MRAGKAVIASWLIVSSLNLPQKLNVHGQCYDTWLWVRFYHVNHTIGTVFLLCAYGELTIQNSKICRCARFKAMRVPRPRNYFAVVLCHVVFCIICYAQDAE